mmetsp:Transcript_8027/g.15945  ORF Transcript_8027/g.15945 Transcript_8027/m.15945 type:complete len:94 (-) Transcript_8027:317-598(-)
MDYLTFDRDSLEANPTSIISPSRHLPSLPTLSRRRFSLSLSPPSLPAARLLPSTMHGQSTNAICSHAMGELNCGCSSNIFLNRLYHNHTLVQR